jgi:hypothetical protein
MLNGPRGVLGLWGLPVSALRTPRYDAGGGAACPI